MKEQKRICQEDTCRGYHFLTCKDVGIRSINHINIRNKDARYGNIYAQFVNLPLFTLFSFHPVNTSCVVLVPLATVEA